MKWNETKQSIKAFSTFIYTTQISMIFRTHHRHPQTSLVSPCSLGYNRLNRGHASKCLICDSSHIIPFLNVRLTCVCVCVCVLLTCMWCLSHIALHVSWSLRYDALEVKRKGKTWWPYLHVYSLIRANRTDLDLHVWLLIGGWWTLGFLIKFIPVYLHEATWRIEQNRIFGNEGYCYVQMGLCLLYL